MPLPTNDAEANPLAHAHPLGPGAGAGAAGVAGAAIGGAVAGPLGAVVGAAVGALAGGLGGRAASEAVDLAQHGTDEEPEGIGPPAGENRRR